MPIKVGHVHTSALEVKGEDRRSCGRLVVEVLGRLKPRIVILTVFDGHQDYIGRRLHLPLIQVLCCSVGDIASFDQGIAPLPVLKGVRGLKWIARAGNHRQILHVGLNLVPPPVFSGHAKWDQRIRPARINAVCEEEDGVVVIAHVLLKGHADLPLMVQTGCLFGCRFGLSKHGEENGRQDCDDGNNHKQLYQREGTAHLFSLSSGPRS